MLDPGAMQQLIAAVASEPLPEPRNYAEARRREALIARHHAFALLRDADRAEHEDRLDGVYDDACGVAARASARVGELAAAVGPAVAAERSAEDRVRDAAEYHRQLTEAERSVSGTGTPEEQTRALADLRAAADVLQRERAACEGARARRVQAEEDLAGARVSLAAAETERVAREADLDAPGRPPLSLETCVLDPLLAMTLSGGELTREEKAMVSLFADVLARMAAPGPPVPQQRQEDAGRPVAVGDTVMPPGTVEVPGGFVPPGVPAPR